MRERASATRHTREALAIMIDIRLDEFHSFNIVVVRDDEIS
jgi:hypothetical protein